MSSYHRFRRPTAAPDPMTLLAAVRTAASDPTAGISTTHATEEDMPDIANGTPLLVVKKATPWTSFQIELVQQAIDAAPALTPQRAAQNEIDRMAIHLKAAFLVVNDRLNALGNPMTPGEFLAAIRTKAGNIS